MTPEELEMYRAGFKVAVNYLYHHQPNEEERIKFEEYLNLHMDPAVVQGAINLQNPDISTFSGSLCPPGECPGPGGKCVVCRFEFAFDGTYFMGKGGQS